MSPRVLEELQSRFAESLVHDACGDSPILSAIADRGPLLGSERLRIYQEAYWIRMNENLEEDYPALRRLMGASEFRELVRAFITGSPQAHPSLIRLGAELPRFLERHFPNRLELASVARLEWAKIEVRHAAASNATLGALPALPAEMLFRIRLIPSSTSRLLELPHQAGRWMLEADAHATELKAGPETVMVVRRGFEVFVEPVSGPFGPVLARLFGGAALAEAVAALDPASVEPNAVTEAFAGFLQRGYFERFEL